jgi:hypothetical protein
VWVTRQQQRSSGRRAFDQDRSSGGAPLSGQCVITREVVVAEGVFAPGHLGELTQIVPFEMVDAVLADSAGTQHRLRKLPARVVVYVLLAGALFGQIGYPAVWRKLTGPLEGLPVPKITATALWHARTRLGPRPLRALFDLLRGPATAPGRDGPNSIHPPSISRQRSSSSPHSSLRRAEHMGFRGSSSSSKVHGGYPFGIAH